MRGWRPKSRLGMTLSVVASGRRSIFSSQVLSDGSSPHGLGNIPVVGPLLLVFTYVPGTVLTVS